MRTHTEPHIACLLVFAFGSINQSTKYARTHAHCITSHDRKEKKQGGGAGGKGKWNAIDDGSMPM